VEPKGVMLQRLLQTFGKTIILSYDQGLEHRLGDFMEITAQMKLIVKEGRVKSRFSR
jgi:DhnA family fructose-bisphosphate aldolase class Ia